MNKFRIFSFMMCLLAISSLAAFSAQAAANGFDSKEPIEISSDSLEVLQKDRVAVFRGNVIAKQGKVTLNANEMKVYYKEGGDNTEGASGSVSKIEVNGNVLLVTAQESAESDKGVYQVDTKHVTMLGNVSLTKDKSVIKGNRLEYDLASGKSVLTSLPTDNQGKKGNRVRGVFVPEEKQ